MAQDFLVDTHRIRERLPILPLAEVVIFPYVMMPVVVGEPRQIKLVEHVLARDKLVAVFSKRTGSEDEGELGRFYPTGCAATILKMFKMPDGKMGLLLQGLARIRLEELLERDPFLLGRISPVREDQRSSIKTARLRQELLNKFQIYNESIGQIQDEVKEAILNIREAGKLADVIAANLNISVEMRQKILDTLDLDKRLLAVIRLLQRELKLKELHEQIRNSVDEELDAAQREHYLREQIRIIRRELGEEEDHNAELDALARRAAELDMNDEARVAVKKEIAKLRRLAPGSPEKRNSLAAG